MRARRLAVALVSAMSMAASGQEPVRSNTPHAFAAHASTVTQDIPVRLGAGGRVYSAIAPASVGYVVFTNLAVDVDRYPIVQIEVSSAKMHWRAHLGLHGEPMTNVFSSGGSGLALNLFGSVGWRGTKAIDILVQLKDDVGVVRFDLGSEADKDVVCEAGKTCTASPFGQNPASPQCFVETGRKHKGIDANGLPVDRLAPSSDKELGAYLLLPYTGMNVIELPTSANAPAESHVILVPKFSYSKIGILAASQGGDASFTLILRYTDGTVSTNWFESDDWYRRSRGTNIPVLEGMDRALASDGSIEDSNHFNLYEFICTSVDRGRILESITIGNDPHRWPDSESRYTAVFAVNGRADILPASSR